MIFVASQRDLKLISSGGSGNIYVVDDNIVLKAPHIYEEAKDDGNFRDVKEFRFFTLRSYESIDYERHVLKRLMAHESIVQPFALTFPEGIYMGRHRSLRERLLQSSASLITRLLWYADICNGLVHLHETGLVQVDLRICNILCDQHDRAVICDLGSVKRMGCANDFATPECDGTVDLNGVSDRLNAVTDLFAFGSLVFEIETGQCPSIKKSSSSLDTPVIATELKNLDSLITDAWLGQYTSAEAMLGDIKSLLSPRGVAHERPMNLLNQEEVYNDTVRWRQRRIEKHGSVLQGLLDSTAITRLQQSLDEMRGA